MEAVKENNGLYVGIDIGSRITQIAVYNEEKYEPICIGEYDDENKNYILTEKQQDDRERFCSFLAQCVSHIKRYGGSEEIAKITVTVRDANRDRAEMIRDAFSIVGVNGDDIQVISYRQSYMYYVLSQSQEFWVNDAALFDYSENGLIYCQLTVDRRRKPYVAGVLEKDYSSNMPYGSNHAFMFENIAENALHKQIISTIYMTGPGFEGGWADDSMRKLCRGRRIFQGQNLYVKGACYAARHSAGLGIMPECVFIDDDMIRVHISTNVYVKTENQEVILAKAGTLWYEVDNSIYIIPDNENEIVINVTNVITRDHMKHLIPIDFVDEERENMTTKLRLRIRFQSPERLIVTIKDEGFGEICHSSGRIYERIIRVE